MKRLFQWRYYFAVDGARRAFEKGHAHETNAGTPSFGRLSPGVHHIPIPAVTRYSVALTVWLNHEAYIIDLTGPNDVCKIFILVS